MVIVGLCAGLGAALAHSISYLLSRRYLHHTGHSVIRLLVIAHMIMGVMALVLIPWMRPRGALASLDVWVAIAGAAGFYMVGQVGLFWALRRVESSRVAPLLGLKILVLAAWTVLIQHHVLGPWRWLAVGLSIISAFLLNETGGRLPLKALVALGVAITGYCFSDLNIVALVSALTPHAGARAPYLGVCLSYIACGMVSLPLYFRLGRQVESSEWRSAFPYALTWFLAMVLLYICFTSIGVVFGNIVQSTRGLISICLGPLIAHWGWTNLESRIPRRLFWRRLVGGVLMFLAIAIYVLRQ